MAKAIKGIFGEQVNFTLIRITKMNILNIHGYKGNANNSAYEALLALGHSVVSPEIDYDAVSPDEVLDMLYGTAEKSGAEMLVGSSLGGFYAAVMSVRLGLPAVLINPCMMPFLHLPRLGFEGETRPFITLFGEFAAIDDTKITVIVGGNDEVIDTHDMTRNLLKNSRFEVVPNGGHSGSTLPLEKFFREVLGRN